jgi:CheY-like chemotaxis protein
MKASKLPKQSKLPTPEKEVDFTDVPEEEVPPGESNALLPSPADDSAKARVLIAEDDRRIREALVDIVTDLGCNVMEARDGAEALDVALKHNPDLLLLDVMMPKLDGFQVLRELRTHPETQDLMVIQVTAVPAETGEQEAMKLRISVLRWRLRIFHGRACYQRPRHSHELRWSGSFQIRPVRRIQHHPFGAAGSRPAVQRAVVRLGDRNRSGRAPVCFGGGRPDHKLGRDQRSPRCDWVFRNLSEPLRQWRDGNHHGEFLLFEGDMMDRLQSMCDTHISLRSERIGGKVVKALEVRKANNVELNRDNTVNFQVDQQVGMRIMPPKL